MAYDANYWNSGAFQGNFPSEGPQVNDTNNGLLQVSNPEYDPNVWNNQAQVDPNVQIPHTNNVVNPTGPVPFMVNQVNPNQPIPGVNNQVNPNQPIPNINNQVVPENNQYFQGIGGQGGAQDTLGNPAWGSPNFDMNNMQGYNKQLYNQIMNNKGEGGGEIPPEDPISPEDPTGENIAEDKQFNWELFGKAFSNMGGQGNYQHNIFGQGGY